MSSRGPLCDANPSLQHGFSPYQGLHIHHESVAWCFVQGPFSVNPGQTLLVRFATNESLNGDQRRAGGEHADAHTSTPALATREGRGLGWLACPHSWGPHPWGATNCSTY
jgi:hypothetical protein